jgi:soluble lytic murein transglycosylase-like protein
MGGWRGDGLRRTLRALPVAALLTVPVWAALGSSVRVAEVPASGGDVDWVLVGDLLEGYDARAALEALVVAQREAQVAALGVASVQAAFPPSVARWRELVEREIAALRGAPGLHEAVTPDLVLAVIAAESGGDPAARSPAQALGLMQVLPATLAGIAARSPLADGPLSVPPGARLDALDPRLNVRAGILYLDEAVRRHEGDVPWALAAYNAGIPTSVRARTLGTALWPESDRFVARVMATLQSGGGW